MNSASGDLYAADGYGLNFVTQYNHKGAYIRHFSGKCDTDSTFDFCHGVLVDTRDRKNPTLLISDRSHMRLKVFTFDRKHLATIPVPGSFVCRPVLRGLCICSRFRSTSPYYPNNSNITVLDEKDLKVSTPGGTEPIYAKGTLQEQRKDRSFLGFLHPHNVCVDFDENIYVSQWSLQENVSGKAEKSLRSNKASFI